MTRADDFIVSDRLISRLLTQVSENKQLNAVFTDLFDAEGTEIYLKPAADYVTPGREVTYATIVEAARRISELDERSSTPVVGVRGPSLVARHRNSSGNTARWNIC